jgi:hypothetical protein
MIVVLVGYNVGQKEVGTRKSIIADRKLGFAAGVGIFCGEPRVIEILRWLGNFVPEKIIVESAHY